DTAAGAGRGAVDVAVAGDGRRDVRPVTADRFAVTPQKLARLGLHTHQTLLQELNVLPDAAGLDDDRGGKSGLVAFRHRAFPNEFPRLLIESDYCSLAPAGSAHERVPVNQRRLRVGPLAGFAAEVRAEILLPAQLARI